MVRRKVRIAMAVSCLMIFPQIPSFAAGSVVLAWDASPDATAVGYRIYYGVASGNYTNSATVGNVTNATLTGLADGVTYYFAAKAYNSIGDESIFSNETSYSVPGANVPPTLNAISALSLNEDAGLQTVNLAGISSGSVNETQTLTVTATSSNPSLIPNPTVNYTSPNAAGSLSFTPVTGANGSATVTVTVNDGQAANNTFTRTFVVTVNAVNNAPTLAAVNDVTVAEDAGAQTVNLSGISSGAANEAQTLNITATSSNPGLIPNPSVNYTSPNGTGSLRFTPVANQNGTAVITVTVNDGQSLNNTVSRIFTVTVNPVNDAPTLNVLNNLSIAQNAGNQIVDLAGITSGAANEAQTLAVTVSSSNPGLIPTPTVTYLSPNATGSLSFTPVANANGTATITVTVNDGQAQNNTFTRTFTVNVAVVNVAPTLAAIGNVTVNEDAGVQTVNLSGIGTGSGTEVQTLTVTATSSDPSVIPNPTVNYTSPNASGSLTFTPAANANGTATITVTVDDGQSANNTVSRTFQVTVNPVNDAPTLNALNPLNIAESAGLQTVPLAGISSGAANESQTLTITAVSSDPSVVPNPAVSYSSPNSTGNLTFTPVANVSGTATITVTVNDGQTANNTISRSFTVSVSEVNNAPTLAAISNLSINEDAGVQTVNLAGIGTGAAGEAQTLTVTATSSNPGLIPNPAVNYTSPNATGSLSLTAAANSNGTAIITVTVNDGQALNNTVSRTFTVSVNAVNDAPTLSPISNVTINEDAGAQTVNFGGISTGAANESQTLTVTATSSNPGLIPNPTVNYSSPNGAGSLNFTPVANGNGPAVITVTVHDGQAANNSVTQTFTVTVTPVNDAPTLNNINPLTIAENAGLQTVSLTGIGTGAANETQTLTITATSSDPGKVPNPTVNYTSPNASGSLTFTPASNANGNVTITVTVNDSQSANNTITRTFGVTITSVNSAPTISSVANQTVVSGTSSAPLNVTIGDVETPAASLALTATSSAPGLLPVANIVFGGSSSNRTVRVTPASGQTGTATVTLTVNDGQTTASTSFVVTVQQATSQLSVTKTGEGTVTPDLNTMTLVVGQSYTVTATPATGYEFKGWTGGIISSAPTLTFVMASNLVLQANFVASPYLAASATYNGLFNETAEVRLNSSGAFNVYVGTSGDYSGWLQTGFTRFPFSGKLDLNLRGTNAIARWNSTTLTVELDFSNAGQSGWVAGRVTDGTWSAPLSGSRATVASPFAGQYTVAIPGWVGSARIPAGDGYATLSVATDGSATLSGTLADGAQFMQSAIVSDTGNLPVYVSLYSAQGVVMSWLNFANVSSSDVSGQLVWIKQAGASAASYPLGFTNSTKAVGSLYVAPAASDKAVNLSSASVGFFGGELAANFSNAVSVNAGSQVVNLSPSAMTLGITTGAGTFAGQVVDPATGVTHNFGGVLLQKQNTGYGFMSGVSASSRVVFGAP